MIGRVNKRSITMYKNRLKKLLELKAKIINAANDITYNSNDYSCVLPPDGE